MPFCYCAILLLCYYDCYFAIMLLCYYHTISYTIMPFCYCAILDAHWTSKHFQTSFTHRFWRLLVLPQRAAEPGTVTDTSGLRENSNRKQLGWRYRLTFWPFDRRSFKHSTQHVTSEHSLVVAMRCFNVALYGNLRYNPSSAWYIASLQYHQTSKTASTIVGAVKLVWQLLLDKV